MNELAIGAVVFGSWLCGVFYGAYLWERCNENRSIAEIWRSS